VVATTGIIADTAARIAGPHARIEALMGLGIDPHLYKASESDVRRLSEAGLILYNGLHLEGKMGDILTGWRAARLVIHRRLGGRLAGELLLLHLRKGGEGLPVAVLERRFGWEPRRLQRVLSRLLREGWVERAARACA